ncbi:MAG: hypothetical protein P4M00_03740 [Azospirillaceae bacterium]|nr:hypothetical protein [Azospirillaceae bacterium]
MRRRAALAIAVIGILAAAPGRAADENSDLDMIPGTPPATAAPVAPQTAVTQGTLTIEDAAALGSRRGGLVVPLPAGSANFVDWQNRTSLNGRHDWHWGDDVTVTVSDRLNLYFDNNIAIPSHQQVGNDFREGYLTWEVVPQNYLEVGRINVKHGVAMGFNPTDFFKTRTSLNQSSADPSALRENRLGTVMVRGQTIFTGGAVTLAVAPRLRSPQAIDTAAAPSLDPVFGQTNGHDRLLLTGSFDLIPDVSSEFLFYHEDDQNRIGANFSVPIGDAVIAYAEGAGGRQRRLADAAERFGRQTGTLPASAADLLSTGTDSHFRSDAVLGASWTSTNKITVNLEYHFHEAGFSGSDWRHWFATGAANAGSSLASGPLWYLRSYAQDQQEPMSRQELFVRADWTDALVPDLELTAFAQANPHDGSVLTQVAASYFLSDTWTVGAVARTTIGGPRSEYGSLAQARSVILQIIRYF